jgi:integrase
LHTWAELAGISLGPVFRPVSTGNRAVARPLSAQTVNYLVQAAIKRAGLDPLSYSAHSLRAGFVTYAHLRGASDRAIAHQTRHRSMATLGQYVRIHEAWQDNAATQLAL